VEGFCEHGSDSWGYIKDGRFLDHLNVLPSSQDNLCFMLLVV